MAKLANREFCEDLDQLVAESPAGYTLDTAADLVMKRLGVLLDGAPDLSEIDDGAWRSYEGKSRGERLRP